MGSANTEAEEVFNNLDENDTTEVIAASVDTKLLSPHVALDDKESVGANRFKSFSREDCFNIIAVSFTKSPQTMEETAIFILSLRT